MTASLVFTTYIHRHLSATPDVLDDFLGIPPNSSEKIRATCTFCGEEVYRERCLFHLPHNCPRFMPSKGLQRCASCLSYSKMPLPNVTLCAKCSPTTLIDAVILDNLFKAGIKDTDIWTMFRRQLGRCFRAGTILGDGLRVSCITFDGDTIVKPNNIAMINFSMLAPPVRLEAKMIHGDGQMPVRKRTTDAGYDVHSIIDAILEPASVVNIPTGIAVAAPAGHYYSIEGRSSLWTKGVMPYRGIVDGTYTGDLMVAMTNTSAKAYEIKKGDRIAQLVLHTIVNADIVTIEDFSPDYNVRGISGFGSSGR